MYKKRRTKIIEKCSNFFRIKLFRLEQQIGLVLPTNENFTQESRTKLEQNLINMIQEYRKTLSYKRSLNLKPGNVFLVNNTPYAIVNTNYSNNYFYAKKVNEWEKINANVHRFAYESNKIEKTNKKMNTKKGIRNNWLILVRSNSDY